MVKWLKGQYRGIIIGVVLFAILYEFISVTYYHNFPILLNMQAEVVERGDGFVTLKIEGFKLRDCTVTPGSPLAWYTDDLGRLNAIHGEMIFARGPTNNPTLHLKDYLKKQVFGPLTITGINASVNNVKMTLSYICDNTALPLPEIMGPWRIPTLAEAQMDKES